jgi:glycosyltransferase involved in cell wall biosynthesis
VPAGLVARLASRAPLVLTAHGRDVRNVGAVPGIGALTRFTVKRAAAVITVSDYLRRELEAKVPEAHGKTEVIDSGVDLGRFPVVPAPDGPKSFLCLGSLSKRKNVVHLAEAFERLGEGTLTFVGDGPLRARLQTHAGVQVVPAVPHSEVPARIAAAHVVCQPSLVEPFGQAVLEAMACGRSVVATRIGGPPEFVPPEAGMLVDPLDVDAMAEALRAAAALPCPNPAARTAAEGHDVAEQARRVEAVLERAAGAG